MTDTELVARLERLERDNRWLKRIALGVLVLAAAAVGLGAAYAKPAVPQKIVAHEFDLVDGAGNVRASLEFNTNGSPGLHLFDAKGNDRIGLSIAEPADEPGLFLTSPAGKMQAELSVGRHGSSPTLMLEGMKGQVVMVGVPSETGTPGLTAMMAPGEKHATSGVSIGVGAAGPYLTLDDKRGYSTVIGSTDLVTPATGETHRTSAASIVMFGNGKEHHVIWEAPR